MVSESELRKIVGKNVELVPFLSQEDIIKTIAFLFYLANFCKDFVNEYPDPDKAYYEFSQVHDNLWEAFILPGNEEKPYELIEQWLGCDCEKCMNSYFEDGDKLRCDLEHCQPRYDF